VAQSDRIPNDNTCCIAPVDNAHAVGSQNCFVVSSFTPLITAARERGSVSVSSSIGCMAAQCNSLQGPTLGPTSTQATRAPKHCHFQNGLGVRSPAHINHTQRETAVPDLCMQTMCFAFISLCDCSFEHCVAPEDEASEQSAKRQESTGAIL
jgi:hypothetical protein